MRFIDADEFIKRLHRLLEIDKITEDEYQRFSGLILEAPTEVVKPATKAEWVGTEYDGYADGNPVYDRWECSKCGCEWDGEEDTLPRYCPDCGAEMTISFNNLPSDDINDSKIYYVGDSLFSDSAIKRWTEGDPNVVFIG